MQGSDQFWSLVEISQLSPSAKKAIQRIALEARIEEIERCEHLHGYSRQGDIDELKQQLQELNDG